MKQIVKTVTMKVGNYFHKVDLNFPIEVEFLQEDVKELILDVATNEFNAKLHYENRECISEIFMARIIKKGDKEYCLTSVTPVLQKINGEWVETNLNREDIVTRRNAKTLNVSNDVHARLDKLATETGKSKARLVLEGVEYLEKAKISDNYTLVSIKKESHAKLNYLCQHMHKKKSAILERAIEELYAKLFENRIDKVILTEVEPGSLRYDVFYNDKSSAVQVHKKGEFTVTQETINFITMVDPEVMENKSVVYMKQTDSAIEINDYEMMVLGGGEFGTIYSITINNRLHWMAQYRERHVLYNDKNYWSYDEAGDVSYDEGAKNLVAKMIKAPGKPITKNMLFGFPQQFKDKMEYHLSGGWRARIPDEV